MNYLNLFVFPISISRGEGRGEKEERGGEK
jgi:hypothetical protein